MATPTWQTNHWVPGHWIGMVGAGLSSSLNKQRLSGVQQVADEGREDVLNTAWNPKQTETPVPSICSAIIHF